MRDMPAREGFANHVKMCTTEVEMLKKLARSARYPSTASEKKDQEKAIKAFKAKGSLMAKELTEFCKSDFESPDPSLNRKVIELTIFMYLYDKTLELHDAVLEKDKVGLFALFDSVRDAVQAILSDDYFELPQVETMRKYLDTEPRLVACADLAGVELMAIQDAVRAYQPKLADLVEKGMLGKEKKSSAKAPKKKAAKKKKPDSVSKKRGAKKKRKPKR
jgi:hypothetical protein